MTRSFGKLPLPAGLLFGSLTLLSAGSMAVAQAVPTPPQILMTAGLSEAGDLLVQTHQSVTRLPAGRQDKPTGYSVKVIVPVSLKGVTFLTADAKPLTLADVRKRVGKGSPVVVMPDGEKPAPAYRRLLAKDVVVFVFPGGAPRFEKAAWPVEKEAGVKDERTP